MKETFEIGCCRKDLSRNICAVFDSVEHTISQWLIVFQFACLMEVPNADDLSVQCVLRYAFLPALRKRSGDTFSGGFRN